MEDKVLDKALRDIEAYYRTQGMARALGFGKRPAVLVIDFQKGITDPERPAGCHLDAEIEHTVRLLDVARKKDVPVFFFVIAYDRSLLDGGLLVKKVPTLARFVAGSDDVQLDPRLTPGPNEPVFAKQYGSCFFGTPLASSLTALNVDTVILTGCITSGCVRATAHDALQHGFRPMLPRECVGDRARIPHEVNLMDIQARIGDVLPLSAVLTHIEQGESA